MLGAESDSAAMKDHKMANDLKIVFETNKSGGLEKVVNWKYVADYGLKASMIYLNDKLNRREKEEYQKNEGNRFYRKWHSNNFSEKH